MKRTIEQWSGCKPESMATAQSEVARTFAFSDARADILELHRENERLREGLRLITCEPINAEYMAQNILDGLPAYHNTMLATEMHNARLTGPKRPAQE